MASLSQAELVARPHIKPPGAACAAGGDEVDGVVTLQTTLAGVPALLRVPKVITKPPIVLWHGFGPPASESALMKALPLDKSGNQERLHVMIAPDVSHDWTQPQSLQQVRIVVANWFNHNL
jgi:hypothetical protein